MELDRNAPLAVGVRQGLDVLGHGDAVAGAIRVAIGQEQRPSRRACPAHDQPVEHFVNTGTANILRYGGMNSPSRVVGGKATVPRQAPRPGQ